MYLFLKILHRIHGQCIAEKWQNWDPTIFSTYIVGCFLNLNSTSSYIGHVFYAKSSRIDTYPII